MVNAALPKCILILQRAAKFALREKFEGMQYGKAKLKNTRSRPGIHPNSEISMPRSDICIANAVMSTPRKSHTSQLNDAHPNY